MKRLFLIPVLCVIAMCVAGCSDMLGSGDGTTNQQGDDKIERDAYYKIGEDAFAFVGTWDISTNTSSYYSVFYPDGACKIVRDDRDYGWEREGVWQYNAQTMMLATTVDDYSWVVTVVGEDSWAGIRQRNKKDSQSFTRQEVQHNALYTLAGTWANGDDTLVIGYGSWGKGEEIVNVVGRSYAYDAEGSTLSAESELNGSGTWQMEDLSVVDKQMVADIVEIGDNDVVFKFLEKIDNKRTELKYIVVTVSDDGLYVSKLKKIYWWYFDSVMYSRVDVYSRVIE